MAKTIGLSLMFLALSGIAAAAEIAAAPEISPESGVAAFALLSGALLVIRGRRKV
jgi:membrane protein implicated in regulation of membrane protease activity